MHSGFAHRGWLRRFDWTLGGLIIAICLLGLSQIYSATLNTQFHGAYPQHIVWLVIGLVLFWCVSHFDYHQSIKASPLLWVVGVLLLVAVLAFTEPINGARRWLSVPFGFSVQVSEFMKVVLILVLARLCGGISTRPLRLRDWGQIVVLIFVPLSLVVLQPDLSTALSLLPLLGMPLLLSTIRLRHILLVCVAGILLMPLGWALLKPYQKDRITGFLNPYEAPQSSGYQILQSKIAVGSGGIWGQGFVQGSQTQLRFLPTPHTDFILAAFAEEKGFVGIAVVLALYYALLMRIVNVGRTAADAEGTLIAMGVAGLLLFHIVVNVGMVANKLPVTGLPLPLMSYGGSHLLTVLIMLGLVSNVRRRRFVE